VPLPADSDISLSLEDLNVSEVVTLTVTTMPAESGTVSCRASVNSSSIDPDFGNNSAIKLLNVSYQSTPDTINALQLAATNFIYDPGRNLIWAALPGTVEAPLGRSIVSINLSTGAFSDPIPLLASPSSSALALSPNGRYLYVGLTDTPEVARIDLHTSPYFPVRVPLGLSRSNTPNYAGDIEVLDGDGTSFIIASAEDHGAAVYDEAVRRPNRTSGYTADRLERLGGSGRFLGLNLSSSVNTLTHLDVTTAGVSVTSSIDNLINYSTDIRAGGGLALSSSGRLLDTSTLTLVSNLGVTGTPCLDSANGRAYLVDDATLYGFSTSTFGSTGSLLLTTDTIPLGWAMKCVRWGLDGFAVLGRDGTISIVRWSQIIPPSSDSNGNAISDQWEVASFGSLLTSLAGDFDADGIPDALEYLFATSPHESSALPLTVSSADSTPQGGTGGPNASGPAGRILRVVFPRRSGVSPLSYIFETSSTLLVWATAEDVTETVLSTSATGDGVSVDTVEAVIPAPQPDRGFVRLRWLTQ